MEDGMNWNGTENEEMENDTDMLTEDGEEVVTGEEEFDIGGESDMLEEDVSGDEAVVDGDMVYDDMVYDDSYAEDGYVDAYYGGDYMDGITDSTTEVKDPILSSVPFVAGTIGVALVIGIVLGILLGRKRIKKGFDLYED